MTTRIYKKSYLIFLSVVIAALLGLVGTFMLTPKTTAMAEDSTPSNNLYWGFDEDTGVLTLSGTNPDNTLAPYSTVTVSSVVYPAWYNDRSSIISVTVADSVYAPSSMGHWFYFCSNLTTVNLSNLDTSKVTYMGQMFRGCSSLTTLDLSSFNTSLVTNMNYMFGGCSGLTTLDVSSFNTSLVTNMSNMFENCRGLTTLNVSTFDTSSVTNMRLMFNGCSGLTTLDVSNFETSLVTDMAQMFYGCSGLTMLDLSNFETSSVTNMVGMFYGCSGLTTLDLSNFETSSVTNMLSMFRGCSGLTTLDVSNFDTAQVTSMSQMFSGCSGLTSLDFPNTFDTSSVTDMSSMFFYCNNLDTITVSVSLAEKLSTSTNNTYLYSTPHTKWYDEDDNEYTDASRFNQGGTYITAEHTHSGGAATCLEVAICAGCGRAYGNPLGHDIVRHNPQAPTCTESGCSAYETCSRCDHTTYSEIAALGHNLTQHEAKAATCTEKGCSAYETCSRCDHTTYSEIAALGHNLTQHEAKAATCTEKGYSAYESCSRCDHTTYSEIAALGHSYGEWTVVKNATETEEGEQQRVCANDSSHVESRVVPKLIPTPQEPEPKTNLTWLWILLVILILLIIATVIYLVYRKKKKAVVNASDTTESQEAVQQEVAPVVTEAEKPETKKPEVTFDQSEVRESVAATEVDSIMSDEVAESLIETVEGVSDKTKQGIINIDTLSQAFESGETVTLDEIKERLKGYNKMTYIKVLARGTLNKPLIIEADSFSLQAVKMIVLTGGKALNKK